MKIRSPSSLPTLQAHNQRQATNRGLLHFFYLLTHWHLSYTPAMNYICHLQTARVQLSQLLTWGRTSTKRRALFLLRLSRWQNDQPPANRREQTWGKQKRDKMWFLSENYRNQAEMEKERSISSSGTSYPRTIRYNKKNTGRRKTNTEGIWKKPHVALL